MAESDTLAIEQTPVEENSPYSVYFLTGRKPRYPVKVGISGRLSLPSRLRSIQTAMPYDLILLYVCPCDAFAFEREIHTEFRRTRIRGEWFKRDDRIMALIRGMNDGFPAWREHAGIPASDWL